MRADDAPRARQLLGECLRRASEIGYHEVLANCVQAAAELGVTSGVDPERAARLQSVARHALDRIGVQPQGLERESFERTAQALADRIGVERLREIADEAAEMPLESVLDDARDLLSEAGPAGEGGDRSDQ
jgi:hypothetical protein